MSDDVNAPTEDYAKTLEDNGVLFLGGNVTMQSSNEISKKIIQANLAPKTPFLNLFISSPGGVCDAGFSLIDVMEWSRIPVHTTALGEASSMAFLILMAGEKGYRLASRHASLLSHKYWVSVEGTHSELVAHREREDRLYRHILEHYIRYTNLKTQKELEKTLLKDVDTWVSVEDALKYGVIDGILPPKSGLDIARKVSVKK